MRTDIGAYRVSRSVHERAAAQAMSVGMGMSAPAEAMLHDVEVRRVKAKGFVKVENVPCEEILVHSSHRDVGLENCIFIEHRTNKTLSEIRQMGIDCPDDWAGEEYDATGEEEAISRDRFDEINQRADDSVDQATRRATYKGNLRGIDEDGDGIAELRRICMVNRHVVVDEETDLIPFACVTPVIQPHRHIGYGYYDFLKEIELAHTALLRIFSTTTICRSMGAMRSVIASTSMICWWSRPGGLVRVQGSVGDAIMPLTHPSTGECARGDDVSRPVEEAGHGRGAGCAGAVCGRAEQFHSDGHQSGDQRMAGAH